MKRRLVLSSMVVAVFMASSVLASSMRIATVDVHSILQTSSQVKAITAKLQKEFAVCKNYKPK